MITPTRTLHRRVTGCSEQQPCLCIRAIDRHLYTSTRTHVLSRTIRMTLTTPRSPRSQPNRLDKTNSHLSSAGRLLRLPENLQRPPYPNEAIHLHRHRSRLLLRACSHRTGLYCRRSIYPNPMLPHPFSTLGPPLRRYRRLIQPCQSDWTRWRRNYGK